MPLLSSNHFEVKSESTSHVKRKQSQRIISLALLLFSA